MRPVFEHALVDALGLRRSRGRRPECGYRDVMMAALDHVDGVDSAHSRDAAPPQRLPATRRQTARAYQPLGVQQIRRASALSGDGGRGAGHRAAM